MADTTTEARASERARTAVLAALRTIGLIALAAGAWLARDILLYAFFAVVLAVVFSFPVAWLQRLVPRGVAVVLVLLLGAGVLTGLGALMAPTLSEQLEDVRDTAPRAIGELRQWMERVRRDVGGPAAGRSALPGGGDLADTAARAAVPALGVVVGGVTKVVLVIVLAAFLVHDPATYRNGLRRLVPPSQEAAFDELWNRLGAGLRRWVGGIIVAMTLMGTLTAVGLLAAGIENWLLLGFLTFLGTFVPYLGAIASAIPGLLVALAQSPHHFFLAVLVYLGVHAVEGYLVEPLVMRKAVEIKPALLLVGQGVFAAIFGILGVAIATPAIACAQVGIEYLWVQRRLRKPPPG